MLFDPDTVADGATYDEPKTPPTGIRLVMVNGRIALRDGTHTAVGSGRMLRYRRPAPMGAA